MKENINRNRNEIIKEYVINNRDKNLNASYSEREDNIETFEYTLDQELKVVKTKSKD